MSKYYVTNEDLIEQMEKFKENGEASEELGQMFLDIARGLSTKGNFKNYTFTDEMISEAVQTCIRFGQNFDSSVSKNAFGYITQICYRSFIGYIKKQAKHSKIKDECYNQEENVLEGMMVNDAVDYSKMARNKNRTEEPTDMAVTECPFCFYRNVPLKKANQKRAKCPNCDTVFNR